LEIQYPTLFRRYLSTLVDGLLLIGGIVVFSNLLGNREGLTGFRIALFLFLLLGYEPVLTAYACTLGQYLLGIRVRRVDAPTRRLSLPAAYVRYLVKVPLGLISFLTIGFTKQQRALHDFAAKSIMIRKTAPGSTDLTAGVEAA
jgi:uncharacterized RDD family membrane protein YckC